MTKSERVNLIQKIVAALCHERAEVAQLTLSEFDFPTNRAFQEQEAPEVYLMNAIRQGKNHQLQELAAHLNLLNSSLPIDPESERRIWAAGFCRCFLSHTSKHKTQAASLKVELLAYGCDVFVAHEDITPTLEWRSEIETALGSCHCLLALLTDDFHGSKWTDQESGFVLGRGLPVVSIRAGTDPYGLMDKLQAVPFNQADLNDVAEAIFIALNSKQQTAQHVASGAVQAFLDSPKFVDAKKRMGIVERLAALTPELRERLKDAETQNSQIAGSWGVPGRLKNLLGSEAF
jgi:hypothetical protein